MKRALLLAAALATLMGFAWPARQAQASVSVGVSIGSGRHGGFSLSFASRPNVVLIPSSRVYYAPDLDEDLYCYDDEWYYCDDGTWYSADSYDGPFFAVEFTSVPYPIRSVPVSYRRHWGSYTGYSGYSGYSSRSGYSRYSAPTYRSTYRAPVVTRERDQVWNNNQSQQPRPGRTWTGNEDQNDRGHDGDRGNGQGRGNGRGRGNQGHGHGNNGRWGR